MICAPFNVLFLCTAADPAAVSDSDVQKWNAFREAFRALESRIKVFVSLPLATLHRMSLERQVQGIGRMRPDVAEGQAS